jgi:hypothetical protein
LERRPSDLAIYGTLVDRQRRILEALGLKRQPRDITAPVNGDLTPELKALIKQVKAKSKSGKSYAV